MSKSLIKSNLVLATILVVAQLLAACSSENFEGPSGIAGSTLMAVPQKRTGEFLAYEHSIVVDVENTDLAPAHQTVLTKCASISDQGCTILDSSINTGTYSSASVSMRVVPDSVSDLIAAVGSHGTISGRSTHVEDLATTIADTDKRREILVTTRDKLLELEAREPEDVESLIRIVTELTKVQHELEAVEGESAYQRRRVDLDILNIRFSTAGDYSFWSPIHESIGSFGEYLSDGIAGVITAFAYLIPWSIFLFVLGFLVRFAWRKARKS